MSFHNLGVGAQVKATSIEIFDRFGVRMVVGSDFNEYHKELLKFRPHQPLGAPFDPTIHNMSSKNCFWVIGYDSDNRVVHTQAMRVIDLGSRSLADHMNADFRKYPPVGVDLDLDASRYRPGPGARRITGKAAYHGELWIDDKSEEFRGTGLSELLGQYAFLLALERFDPDFVFGFVARPVAHKGLAERLGFMHNEPRAVNWRMAESPKVLEGYMVYMSNEDLHFVLGLPVHDFVA